MIPYFKCGSKIATSSFVEAEFSQLKTRVFKNELPIRIDKFILRHLEYLNGRLRLTVSASNEEIIASKNISNSQDFVESGKCTNDPQDDLQVALNEIENWRCKIEKEASTSNQSQKRKNYLTPCADWDFVDKTIGIPLLKNGSLCNATTVNSVQIVVRET